jgi:hypothetical protein
LGEETARQVASSLVAPIPEGAYIDHQSRWTLPGNWDGGGVDQDFLRAIEEILYRPDVLVLGGNDNGTGDGSNIHPLAAGGGSTPLSRLPTEGPATVARRDGDHWVLFSRHDGTKIRMSFADDPQPYTHASAPELVDMKITDRCSKGCSYCYQDSKPDGQHAEAGEVRGWLYSLAQIKVFEVALGGGDPVLHPEFFEFVKLAKRLGIVPNFSTRQTGWLREGDSKKAVEESCGRVGFSIDSRDDADRVMAEVVTSGFPRDKVSFHFVMGGSYRCAEVLSAASYWRVPVVLLGYKHAGRAKHHCRPVPYADWIKVIQGMNAAGCRAKNGYACLMAPTVSIDTALAKEFAKELDEAQVPRLLWSTEEGRFSCYIDALSGLMGPSSFCPPEQMVKPVWTGDGDERSTGIAKAFQAFSEQP